MALERVDEMRGFESRAHSWIWNTGGSRTGGRRTTDRERLELMRLVALRPIARKGNSNELSC